MVEQYHDKALSEVLKAVSDTTRRSLLTLLVQQGPTRVTDLAGFYEISLNAISKHIKVLEKAGLVTRKTAGRVHWIEANLEPVERVDEWFSQLKSMWALSLDRLGDLLTEEEKNNE
jgi:DNA-binding transcriptional ArsR family regulator